MLSKNAPPKIACCGGRYDGGKVKLVAGAGETSEPHTFETVVGLEMSKAHLNALAFIPRFEKRFVPIRRHASRGHLREHHGVPVGQPYSDSIASCTSIAVEFGGAVAEQVAVVHGPVVCRQMETPCRLSQRKSLREKVPSSRSLASRTGICGAIPRPTSQPRKWPVP